MYEKSHFCLAEPETFLFSLCLLYLVFMAGALTVLCQTLQSLVNEGNVLLIDVQSQQAEAPCGAATDAV